MTQTKHELEILELELELEKLKKLNRLKAENKVVISKVENVNVYTSNNDDFEKYAAQPYYERYGIERTEGATAEERYERRLQKARRKTPVSRHY